MGKKAPTEPMECQSARYGDAIPMAPASAMRAQNPRAMATAISDARVEKVRQRSLTKQRAQIATTRKRKNERTAKE
jgi:hypothetical protein